jgi:hypothetical protein
LIARPSEVFGNEVLAGRIVAGSDGS